MAINAFQIKYKNTMAVNIEIGADFRKFFEKVAEAEAKFKAVGTGMQKVGLGMSVAVSAPLTLIAREAIKASGELSKIDEELGQIRDVAMKELGKAIIEAFNLKDNMPKFRAFLEKLVTAFQNLNPEVKKWGVYIGAVAVAAGPLLIALGTFVNLIPVLSAGLALLTGPIGLVIAAIMALGVAFIYIKYNLQAFKDFFGNIWIRIKNGFIDTIKGMLFAYKKLADILGLDIGKDVFNWLDKQKEVIKENTAAFKSFGDTFREVATDVKAKLFTGNSLFKLDSPESLQGAKEGVRKVFTAIGTELKSKTALQPFADWAVNIKDVVAKGLEDAIVVPLVNVVSQAQQIIIDFNQALGDLVRSSAVGFATAIGEGLGALANGGTIQDFGKGLLATVADFITQLGKLIIGYAIAMSGLEAAISNPGMWPVALAAGIALVAIGSAISGALSKGLDGGGGGSYSGGGGGGFGGVQYNPQPILLETRIEGRELILVQKRTNSFTR